MRLIWRSARRIAAAIALLTSSPVMLAATPEPLVSPAQDGVYALTGTWTCRTIAGETVRQQGVRDGDAVRVADEITSLSGRTHTLADRYVPVASGGWHVTRSEGSTTLFEGSAPPWTGGTWEVPGRANDGRDERVRFQRLPDGDLRKSVFVAARPGFQPGFLDAAELCSSGEHPPPDDACIAENVPATTLWAAQPQRAPAGVRGDVRVVITLDERSQVVAARILSTSSVLLNPYALDDVRRSRFRTEIRDCRPVKADFIYTVSYE